MTDKIKNLKKTVVIKYALVAVIVVYVALLLIFTSGSTKSFAAVEKKVEASLDTKVPEGLRGADGGRSRAARAPQQLQPGLDELHARNHLCRNP